jgi:pseudouridine-5'-phosphate glycosidase
MNKNPHWLVHPDVQAAIDASLPVVALESTVITHGLPYPENLELAFNMELEIKQAGATPATSAVLDGKLCIGLDRSAMERLATEEGLAKVSARDIAATIVKNRSGGTTVAGTLIAASSVGIRVFATGGIGGVHRLPRYDISADLIELSRRPMVVVCAGAKAILDLPATLETLETLSVPVIGFKVDEFPAFYARTSGLPTSARVDSPEEAAELAAAHWRLGQTSAILLVQPPPEGYALPTQTVQKAVDQALDALQEIGIRGQEVTPFLLQQVSELTGGLSLRANLALLRNNARLAAEVAIALKH